MSPTRQADRELDSLIAEIIIDCYDEHEALSAFENAFDEDARCRGAGSQRVAPEDLPTNRFWVPELARGACTQPTLRSHSRSQASNSSLASGRSSPPSASSPLMPAGWNRSARRASPTMEGESVGEPHG